MCIIYKGPPLGGRPLRGRPPGGPPFSGSRYDSPGDENALIAMHIASPRGAGPGGSGLQKEVVLRIAPFRDPKKNCWAWALLASTISSQLYLIVGCQSITLPRRLRRRHTNWSGGSTTRARDEIFPVWRGSALADLSSVHKPLWAPPWDPRW